MAHNNVPRTRDPQHAVTLETHREIKKAKYFIFNYSDYDLFCGEEDKTLEFELWIRRAKLASHQGLIFFSFLNSEQHL